jgi:hypothetical protein
MLHSIEIEIDTNGYIHSPEPLPAGRRGILTLFDEPEKNTTPANAFQNLFGILKAKKSVSLDEIEHAISSKAQERFNDCN